MKRQLVCGVVAAALAATAVVAQQVEAPPDTAQPPLTFRVEANFVEVDAFVSDASGRPVTDLRAGDFQVAEDGKPQMVSAFAYVNIPIARADRPLFSPTAIEADVDTNVAMDGRLYLFVLDDLHVDLTRGPRVKEALHRFFERNFGANDMAAVVFTSGRAVDGQEFTNNPRLLLTAVDKFMGRKMRSPTLERIDEYNRQRAAGSRNAGDPVNDPAAFERAYNARGMLDSLRKLSEFMAGLHGRRKALVLVSEGIDYNIYNLFDNNSAASDIINYTRDAIAAATRANVTIYAVDPRGLMTPGSDLIESSGIAADEPNLGLGVQSAMEELRLSQDSLRELAEETGGVAFVNRNNVDEAFDRILAENSSYYVLGYYPINDRRDGRFRRIEVRVTRPGLMVRARRGYVAARGRPATPKASTTPLETALQAAIESPLPTAGIPMRLFAAPYKGAPPNAAITLAVELNVNALKFTEKNGTQNDALTVVTVVSDADGKTRVNEKATVDLTLMPMTYARARERGFRVTSAINLPPGRYQLRVSAADTAGVAGSVARTLIVPDFYKPPLVMSGLTVLSASGLLAPTAKVKDDPVGQLLMRPPTTAREFTRDDQLVIFAELYENQQNAQPHKVGITTEVRAEGGRVVFTNTEERVSTELQGGTGSTVARGGRAAGGYGFTAEIPLKNFAPGLYVVHVEGKRTDGNVPPAAREVQIRVR